jgi:hypothetical protein
MADVLRSSGKTLLTSEANPPGPIKQCDECEHQQASIALLPIKPRQQEQVEPSDSALASNLSLNMPIESRQLAPLPLQSQRRTSHFITETVTTPLRAAARRSHAPSRESHPKETIADRIGAHCRTSYPRWALSASDRGLSGSESGCHGLFDGASPSFLRSPLARLDSLTSIKYATDVFLQARHKTLEERYDIVACIGHGRGCAVYTVENKQSGRVYACKWLNKIDHETKDLLKETEMLKKLDHPNINKLIEILEDEKALFLILELCYGGDLCEKIAESGLDEKAAKIVMRQVLGALAFCHEKKVVHRDVKPENLLLETEDPKCLKVKLADFGISTAIHHRFDSGSREWPSFCQVGHDGSGSTPYMAPEMFQHRGSGLTDNEHSTKCDVWSAGVLLYVMLSGYYPYGDDYSTPARICSGELVEFSEDRWQHVSEDAKDLIRSLMQHDVEKRPAAHQALEHQWFHSPESTSDYPGFDATFFVEHSPNELAHILLQKLRKWRKMPQLRRWAIAAMARNLTGDYEA